MANERNQLGQFLKVPMTSERLRLNSDTDESGCWIWKSAKTPAGYGKTWLNGKSVLVHRATWILANGAIPEGKIVRHKCDNPSCCNPDHLEIGTLSDNAQDAIIRGRRRLCEKSYMAKLTREQAIYALQSKEPPREVAKRFGVTKNCITAIRNRKSWKSLSV